MSPNRAPQGYVSRGLVPSGGPGREALPPLPDPWWVALQSVSPQPLGPRPSSFSDADPRASLSSGPGDDLGPPRDSSEISLLNILPKVPLAMYEYPFTGAGDSGGIPLGALPSPLYTARASPYLTLSEPGSRVLGPSESHGHP